VILRSPGYFWPFVAAVALAGARGPAAGPQPDPTHDDMLALTADQVLDGMERGKSEFEDLRFHDAKASKSYAS